MTSTSTPPRAFSPLKALGVLLAAACTGVVVAVAVGTRLPVLVAAAAMELGALAVILVFADRQWRLVGLRVPPVRFFVAGALVGATMWLANNVWVSWLDLPEPKGLDHAVIDPPLAVVLAATCLAAPVAEEVIFRGVIARTIATKLHAAIAIAISALVFGAFHMNLAQAVPATVLGLAFAYITLRADSILPTILGHALNNLFAVLLTRYDVPILESALAASPVAVFAVALAISAGGLAVAR
jgi:membrane protease YdiL (CAAX protease family)